MHATRIAAVFVAALSPIAAADHVVYEVVDLGRPDTNDCFCSNEALNNLGETAGFFFGLDGNYNGFLYADGAMLDYSPPGDNRTFSRGMNDNGIVVGWTTYWPPQRGFRYDGETFTELQTLGGPYSEAKDVNNAGDIVGSAYTGPPDEYGRAALWRDGDIINLGAIDDAPFSEAKAINENGMIVGWSWNADWDRRAAYWTADLEGPIELPSFSPPERHTIAHDVNDAEQIVGQVEIEPLDGLPRYRAALWQDGEVIDLGLLPEAGEGTSFYGGPAHISTIALSINNAGVIVGNSEPAAELPEVRFGPFVHENGEMTNLNDLLHDSAAGWMITEVSAINDDGVIAGNGRFNDGDLHAILLVPDVEPEVMGDLDGDGSVGVLDLLALLDAWGDCPDPPAECPADLDDDGVVGVSDLLILLANWG
jgi:probable HAF family extracellular repeat protein